MKRKRKDTGDGNIVKEGPVKQCSQNSRQRSTKSNQESQKDIDDGARRMDNQLLADYIARRIKRFGDHLSPVELESMYIPGALTLKFLERVVIDVSFLDRKQRNIFDMKETQQPLVEFLNKPELKARYTQASASIKLIFY
ncbi:MAG: hypothetical protein Q9203_000297 [Teloschistes exilis]